MGSGTPLAARWYYRTSGKDFGPVTYHDLDQKTRSREILLESEVKLDSDGEWRSILTIAHLLPAIASEAKARGISWEHFTDAEVKPPPAPENSWYFRRGGTVHGPFPFAALLDQAARSTFAPGDEFRAGETGPWSSFDQMQPRLFPGGRAAQTFVPPPKTSEPEVPQEVSPSLTVTGTTPEGGVFSGGSGFFSGLWELYLLPILLIVAKFLRNFWFVPAGILLWIVGNYFVVSWFDVPSTTESYNRLTVIHQELLTHQKNNFKGTDWENYRAKMRGTLKPMIRGLQNSANAMAPGTQHVLWAARDCVDPILDGAADSNEKMSSLSKHLLEARVQMSRSGITTF